MKPLEVLKYPLMGEKATGIREKENKLTFIVDKNATKKDIKAAIEKLYRVEVTKITTLNTTTGKKKAHIGLTEKHSADEVASHFGVL